MRTIDCPVCGEVKRESRASSDYSNVCWSCKKKEADQKRREFLAGRAALTVEERLALIEQWIYDYQPPVDPRSIVFG
jgi:hypothetical protein